MSSKYDEFMVKIASLEKERDNDKKLILKLEEKLEVLERKYKATGIEVRNLPKSDGENKETLVKTFINLCSTFNIHLSRNDIKDIYRINTSKSSPDPVIVELTTVIMKENINKCVKCFNLIMLKPIYVSETLTQKSNRLFYLARVFQRNYAYAFCWTVNGIVYLRKNENLPQIRITAEADLDKLRLGV